MKVTYSLFLVIITIFLLSLSQICTADSEEYDEDTYGPEMEIIWEKPVKGAVFSHKIHTMDAGLDCTDCHDDLFIMEAGAAGEEDDFTMESMEEGSYCGACHDGDMAFSSNTRCTLCHIGVRGIERLEAGESE